MVHFSISPTDPSPHSRTMICLPPSTTTATSSPQIARWHLRLAPLPPPPPPPPAVPRPLFESRPNQQRCHRRRRARGHWRWSFCAIVVDSPSTTHSHCRWVAGTEATAISFVCHGSRYRNRHAHNAPAVRCRTCRAVAGRNGSRVEGGEPSPGCHAASATVTTPSCDGCCRWTRTTAVDAWVWLEERERVCYCAPWFISASKHSQI